MAHGLNRDQKRAAKLRKAKLRGRPIALDAKDRNGDPVKAALAAEVVVTTRILRLMGQRDGATGALAVLQRQYPAQYLACERMVAREPEPTPAESLIAQVAHGE